MLIFINWQKVPKFSGFMISVLLTDKIMRLVYSFRLADSRFCFENVVFCHQKHVVESPLMFFLCRINNLVITSCIDGWTFSTAYISARRCVLFALVIRNTVCILSVDV